MSRKIFNMLTFSPDGEEYYPIAGLGVNSIRKYKSKLKEMKPGDIVVMDHFERWADPEKDGPIVTEVLEVASIVVLRYGTLFKGSQLHLSMNHSLRDSTKFEVQQFFEKCYDDLDENQVFVVIYFK